VFELAQSAENFGLMSLMEWNLLTAKDNRMSAWP